ncbi:alpha/beta hydrolase family protein [Cryptosporangium sp. NPDC048952]|uniref:alpha/beta hydrolase family protein n=1 Tax=Cryptosporangium sp. NPDC048952 TaxID=3363961 RepID=UPI00371ACA8A
MRISTLFAAALMLAVTALPAAASAVQPATFTLPHPTGRSPVGVVDLHLVDEGRPDPWVAGRTRELMTSIWYPAATATGPRAPYLQPAVAATLDKSGALDVIRPGTVDWAGPRTDGYVAAPPATTVGARPVVLYSPGFGVPRVLGTTMAQELASRGYVVVTVDHTYENAPIAFPDGRVTGQQLPPASPERLKKALAVRVQDTRFVLDELARIRRGHTALGRLLDLDHVGMFGHSAGGIEALETMRVDRRVRAGVDLDGTLQYAEGDFVRVATTGLERPFLLMGAGASQTHRTNPSWRSLWTRSTGKKLDVNAPLAGHYSYTDLQTVLPQLDQVLGIPPAARAGFIGTVDPAGMLAAQRAYLVAFFDEHLRGIRRPAPQFPDLRPVG